MNLVDLPPPSFSFERLTIDVARQVLSPDCSPFDVLSEALCAGACTPREVVFVEHLAGICAMAAPAGVSPEAICRLLPLLHACAVNGDGEDAVRACLRAGAGAARQKSPELLSYVQAKLLFRYISDHGYLAHREAYAYALAHDRRVVDVVRVVHVEQPLPLVEEQQLDRGQLQ